MKKYQFILASVLAVAACNPDEVKPDGGNEEDATVSFKVVSVDAVSGISADWTDGAEVSVFDGFSGTKTQTNVLYTASEVDGTKAVLTTKVKKVEKQDNYVAVYPYASNNAYTAADGAVKINIPSVQTYVENGVAAGALPVVASSKTTDLAFKQVCGVFRIELTGEVTIESIEIDADNISGQATVNAATGEITMADNASRNISYNCSTPVQLSGTPTVFNVVLPPATYGELYYTIFASDGTKLEGCDENVQILAGKAVTAETTVYEVKTDAGVVDLSDEGYANCYVVSNPGKYSFDCVLPDGKMTALSGCSAKWVWATSGLWNSQAEADGTKMITDVAYDAENNRITFTAPEGMIYGNVCVALMKNYEVTYKEGEEISFQGEKECIEYTWHLWFTPRISTVTIGGTAFMDRNLGAGGVFDPHSTTYNNCRGLSFQWGRKDPFPGARTGNLVETDASFDPGITTYYCVNGEKAVDRWLNNVVGRPALPSGGEDPGYAFNCQVPHYGDGTGRTIPMYYVDSPAGDVVKAYSQVPMTFLAGGTSHPCSSGGTFKEWPDAANPCPYGYHIPTTDEFSVILDPSKVTVTCDEVVNDDENAGTYIFDGTVNFPRTGYRGYSTGPTKAQIKNNHLDGRYILKSTQSVNANHADWIVIGSGEDSTNLSTVSNYNRLHGAYVRCVKNN